MLPTGRPADPRPGPPLPSSSPDYSPPLQADSALVSSRPPPAAPTARPGPWKTPLVECSPPAPPAAPRGRWRRRRRLGKRV